MALSADLQAELVELQAFRRQLRAIVYGGARDISVDGMRVGMDLQQARLSLREVENRMAALNGTLPPRPVVLNIGMAGNYSDDNNAAASDYQDVTS
jgi:hypothetical protein